ncbi:extracellular solute-binding protein [Oceanobacillus arenosus]|nr:extracellular solute-binding protein [Oceanobacillus arenosus]
MLKSKIGWLSLLLVMVLMITGCSNEETSSKSETSSEGTSSDSQKEMSIHMHYSDQNVFKDDWLVFEEAAKLTGVTLKGTASQTASNSDEVFNLMMASGDIPDIVHTYIKNFNQYGPEGAFIPLNDLIEEHAPNIKKALEENDVARKLITSPDGNIYNIPFIRDGKSEEGWFIRTDWLENLGLDAPETTEDYYNVLTAFKNDDPNGNGKADEIPFVARRLIYFTDLMYLWGAYDALYLQDGEIKYGPMEDEFLDAVKNLAKWYNEGLIDQEVFTRGKNAIVELAGSNTLGAAHDWFGSAANVNAVYKEDIPGFAFEVIAPPTNTKGEKFEETLRNAVGEFGWGISHSNEDPVATIKYFDFWLSEEGRRLMNFGVEGLTYTMEDGKPTFTEEVLSAGNVPQNLKDTYGVQSEIGFQQDFTYEEDWMDPVAKEGIQLYDDSGYYIEEDFPQLSFTPEEQERVNALETSLTTYFEENFQKWILGASDVDKDIDAFRKQLTKLGVDEYLEIQNTAFERFNNN